MIGRADVRRQSGVQSVRISSRGLYGVAVVLLLCLNAEAQNADTTKRPRAADIGVKVGILPAGPINAITDVAGVEVGQTTIIRGNNVRTGVTAILPHGGNLYQERVPGGVFVGNGYGKLTGSTQVDEMGEIETPILLTSTTSVPRVADALISYMLSLPGNENVLSINPIVGETNDGYLNDIRGRYISPEDVTNAIRDAKSGPVDEGTFGAGTGTVAFGWKGGIGTASRRLPAALGGYTVGVLVQSNFGGNPHYQRRACRPGAWPVLSPQRNQSGRRREREGRWFLHDGDRDGRSAGRTQSQTACSKSMGWHGQDRQLCLKR